MSRHKAGGEDVNSALPWEFEIRGSDYELSVFGQDVEARGRMEKALVEGVGSLLLIVVLLLSVWVIWSM
jgi:hypothetical protein